MKGGTLFQQHAGKQKGRGLDVEAEPHCIKHFLKALTRGQNYKVKKLAKGLENWRYFFAISGGRMRCELQRAVYFKGKVALFVFLFKLHFLPLSLLIVQMSPLLFRTKSINTDMK